MFTIEHDFDATTVTIVDDRNAPQQEDIVIHIFEDGVTIEQFDARSGGVQKVSVSMEQLADLRAALDQPEGVYVRKRS